MTTSQIACKDGKMTVILEVVVVLCVTSSADVSFLPDSASPEFSADTGMHMLSEMVSSVTEFEEGDCELLVKNLLATRDVTLSAARDWLEAFAERPEKERYPWREHAAAMLIALGKSGEEDVPQFLIEFMKEPAAADYATFPDFARMETRARLRDYAAYAYMPYDRKGAAKLAMEFIDRDPFASRLCALILDRHWSDRASRAVLNLAGKASWTETIATALRVLQQNDPSMYITALDLFRKELLAPSPDFETAIERFRYVVRRKRLPEAFAILREKAMVKTLLEILAPEDRGVKGESPLLPEDGDIEEPYSRSVTERSIVAIQDILRVDFGYADDQSDEARRAVIDRIKTWVARNM